jgi:hypothetical protein
MARADKVEVVLSNTDRQLLRDIRDALRALNPSATAAPAQARKDNAVRLVEREGYSAINRFP